MPLHTNVADRVHWLEHAHVNSYLIEDDTGLTLVDCGLPAMWSLFTHALRALGRQPEDVRAVLLTHGHFDHVGIAARLHRTRGVPVLVHAGDAGLAASPYRYRPERNRLLHVLRHPGGWGALAALTAAGALMVKGVAPTSLLKPGTRLEVPGAPSVVATPGHTDGHCAFVLPDRDVVLCGDALVTFDPYTGRRGPQIVAGAATADSGVALESLEALAATGVGTLLTGHGAPWRDGAEHAVAIARRVGPTEEADATHPIAGAPGG